MLDIVYKIKAETPKTIPEITPYASLAKILHSTIITTPKILPIICETMLNISSPFVYVGKTLSSNFVLFKKIPPI